MKKILFIFVLSLYSIQGYASSCPDGSEPVKSISADGTYFVFSCGGGSNEQSSSSNTDSSNTKSNSNQAYQSFPVHEFAKSPLRDLKVPENWKLFKDRRELDLFHEEFKTASRSESEFSPWVQHCEQAIAEFDIEIHKLFDTDRAFFMWNCSATLGRKHYQNRETGIKAFEKILLSWASNNSINYPDKNLNISAYSDIAYAANLLIGNFATFYAIYYDDFNFNDKQRLVVNNYLSNMLINTDLEPNKSGKRCILEKPEVFEMSGNELRIYGDYCGSNRWRLGLGAVYLGLRTSNQRLFTAGNRHIEINLATIDKDGIFPMWARKGALALSYQRQLPEVLTLLALAYESIGYDFYEHQLPHGKKIHEVYEALFDFIYHPEKLNKYAFARWDFVGQDAYAFDKLPLKEKWRREYIYPVVLAAQSKGYILEYRPDLMSMAEYTVNDWYKYDLDFVALFTNVSGVAIYESVNQTVSIEAAKKKEKKRIEAEKKKEKKRIEAEKKKEKKRVDAEKYQERLKVEKERLRVEAEVEAEACKTTPLDGEYEARWIRDHWRDIGEWEFVGSEPLILDQCEGQFEGIKQFDPFPTPSVRKKLIVKYQTNGDISIKGDLNLYGIDDLRYTGLYGNIHDGEISGIWGVRNRLKIELIKK
ncbi:alginate lyase family protein [Candidatus Pseudothioglobus singularis]|nr:alginate lyase family protein [Candidatus Pseudothioglobus singularis]MDB4599020.1 alginate lyase family protein [Candidatus Pseudothioglobus singularis]